MSIHHHAMLRCGPQQGTSSLSHSTSTAQSLQGLGHSFSRFFLIPVLRQMALGMQTSTAILIHLPRPADVASLQIRWIFWGNTRQWLLAKRQNGLFTSSEAIFVCEALIVHTYDQYPKTVWDLRINAPHSTYLWSCIFHYVSVFRFNWSACVPAATSAAPIDDGGSVDFT